MHSLRIATCMQLLVGCTAKPPTSGGEDSDYSHLDTGTDDGYPPAMFAYGGGTCALRAVDSAGETIATTSIPGLEADELEDMAYDLYVSPNPNLADFCHLNWFTYDVHVLGQLRVWRPEEAPDCGRPGYCEHMTLNVVYRWTPEDDGETEPVYNFHQVGLSLAEAAYTAWTASTPSMSSATPFDPELPTEGLASFMGPAQALEDIEMASNEPASQDPEELAALLPAVEERWPGLDRFELSWSFDPEVVWTPSGED